MADNEEATSQLCDEITVTAILSSSDDSFLEETTPAVASEAILSVLETPTPASRKRPHSDTPSASRKKKTKPPSSVTTSTTTTTSSKPIRATFTVAITQQFMQICAEIRNAGEWNALNKKFWGPVYKKIVGMMIDRCPGQKWTEKQIKSKWETEQKRYRQYLTILGKSGTSINPDTGIVEASEETWKAFLRQDPKAAWLRTMPLGDVAVYQTVFWNESATGEHTDVVGNDEFSDIEETPAPRLTATQARAKAAKDRRRRLEDPDASSDSEANEDSDDSIPRRVSNRKEKAKSDGARIAQGLKATASAFNASPAPGEQTVSAASRDVWARFGRKYPARLISRVVISKLILPLVAATWNSMPMEGKEALMEEWIDEINLA